MFVLLKIKINTEYNLLGQWHILSPTPFRVVILYQVALGDSK